MSIYDMFLDLEEKNEHRMPGLTIGIVTNIQDPENLGRIKVKLTIRDSDENESEWARVIIPFAGSSMGAYFMPEVDDEVVVAFLGGQLEKPVIIGSVWNKKMKPPIGNEDGKNLTKTIKTKTGHELTFFDEKDKGHIKVKTSKGITLELDDDAKKITVKDSGGKNSVIIEESGNIAVKSEKKIEIASGAQSKIILDGNSGKITLEATTIELKGTQINVKAQAALKVESSATAEVKAGAMLQIKGAMVMIN